MSHHMNAILITNVDSLLGYALAYRFLEEWNRRSSVNEEFREKTEFRLLCRERQGMEELERMGAKVMEIPNYNDPDILKAALRGVSYMMLLPENDSMAYMAGKMMMEQAKKEKVDYVALFSYQGIDHVEKHKHHYSSLYPFYQLEQELRSVFGKDNCCIFRSGMWHQFFYYFGPMISDKNKVQLPIRKDCRWTSIDLGDLVDAVYNLSVGEKGSEQRRQAGNHANLAQSIVANLRKKNQLLFCFTGEETISPHQLTRSMEKSLQLGHPLKFEEIDAATLQKYLKEIHNDNRFRARPGMSDKEFLQLFVDEAEQQQRSSQVGASISDSESRSSHQSHYTFPLGRYLNDNVIYGLLEFWRLADAGHTEETTSDLQKALGRHPRHLEDFFEHNRDQFRRLR